MNNTYIIKFIALVLLTVSSIYYFITTPASAASWNPVLILLLTALLLMQEFKRIQNKRMSRTLFQLITDRGLIALMIILSIDVLYALLTKGIV